MFLRRSAHHERAARSCLQWDRGSWNKFVQLCFHHFVLCLLGREHFREVLCVPAPQLRSGLPVPASGSAVVAFTDLDTFLSRAAQGWQGVLALKGLVCLDREVLCRNPAVVLEAAGLCPKQPLISPHTAAH